MFGFGTVDLSTGVFHLEGSGDCTLPGDNDPSTLDGTVTPDGLTFAGTYSRLVVGTPSNPCVRLTGTVDGARVRGRQTILGKSLSVKDSSAGSDSSKRRIVGSAKEKRSANVLVGDPTLSGAILQIFADGTSPSAQEFILPQGMTSSGRPFWSGSTANGFVYRDLRGDQGAVKAVSIKRSTGGSFSIKVVVNGKHGALNVLPPNPGTDGCMALQLGISPLTVGDRYSVRFGPESAIHNADATLFKASKPTLEEYCPDMIP